MILELSLNDLYTELLDDPDLRRLGPYKIVAAERQTIFPIDIDFGDKDVYLGEGDYTDGFVAFCDTKARSLDLGSSVFTDFYPDFMEIGRLRCSESRASRFYFDDAKLGECDFGSLVAPEVYFDRAVIGILQGEDLEAGIIYIGELASEGFQPAELGHNAHRVTFDIDHPEQADANTETEVESTTAAAAEVKILSTREFLDSLLAENLDLSTFGEYRVVSDDDTPLEINLDMEDREVNLGRGDFTSVSVTFRGTRAKLVDFAESKFEYLGFSDTKIENCFFAGLEAREVHFGDAVIENVFWERGRSDGVYMENLVAGQFNINSMVTGELRLGNSRVREMYLSVGEGVQRMYCEHAELDLLNLHEGRLEEVDFGESRIQKALINKARIGLVKAEGLQADKLYVGNDGKNEIGELRLGLHEGVREVDLEKTFYKDGREVDRPIIKGFGPL